MQCRGRPQPRGLDYCCSQLGVELAGELLKFEEVPEALEYRQTLRAQAGGNPSTAAVEVTPQGFLTPA
jgi:hypothetical protein